MNWTPEAILELSRSYQSAAVFAAAADLELFDALAVGPLTAEALARQLTCDLRGLVILLDALAALRLLQKDGAAYALWPGSEACLTAGGARSMMAMAQHQANCLRRWAQLARVAKTGRSADPIPSVRGGAGDLAAFIGAMHNISAPVAAEVLRPLESLPGGHWLDVGGASGTWTIAYLQTHPGARATLFDLPEVIPLARQRLAAAGVGERVTLAAGDFMADPLPGGVDLAWVSAIVHQNSRAQNRQLFAKVFAALTPGGRIVIRDILMAPSRIEPVAGALFAVNMLVGTPGGGTFTVAELAEDLAAAGFGPAEVLRQDEAMNSLLAAAKPQQA